MSTDSREAKEPKAGMPVKLRKRMLTLSARQIQHVTEVKKLRINERDGLLTQQDVDLEGGIGSRLTTPRVNGGRGHISESRNGGSIMSEANLNEATTSIQVQFECSACGKAHDEVTAATECCPPTMFFPCGRADCELKQRHPDEQEASDCQKGEWLS